MHHCQHVGGSFRAQVPHRIARDLRAADEGADQLEQPRVRPQHPRRRIEVVLMIDQHGRAGSLPLDRGEAALEAPGPAWLSVICPSASSRWVSRSTLVSHAVYHCLLGGAKEVANTEKAVLVVAAQLLVRKSDRVRIGIRRGTRSSLCIWPRPHCRCARVRDGARDGSHAPLARSHVAAGSGG